MKKLSLVLALLLLTTINAVADDQAAPGDPLFQQFAVVEAAALHTQTLEEAPANVTVITADDIRKYGYRTLGEALSSVRGFYSSNDHMYHYMGVRGFSLPGDYNTRFLVMLNGHPLTDNVYDENGSFGQDFGLDMDLIQRIEVIRGPTSALYGSNGIFANINIVTKSPVDLERLRVTAETGSFGEKKASVLSSIYLGSGANLLFSASVFNNGGQNLPRAPGLNGVDGERGYHTFANLVWHGWNVTAYFNSREKQSPVPWGSSAIPFHRGDSVRDARDFILASHTSSLGNQGKLIWQVFYDRYQYHDRFDYAAEDEQVQDVRSIALGDWAGAQLSWQFPLKHVGDLTVGGQFTHEFRNLQQDFTLSPNLEYGAPISYPDQSEAIFVQQEWQIARRWKAYGGVRLDHTSNFGSFLSPRLALVYQRSPKTVCKLVYGRPFRNPSTFEKFYTDGGASFLANPQLRPEVAQTYEASLERKLGKGFSAIVNVYHYQMGSLIVAEFLSGAVEQYRNDGHARSDGAELELSGKIGSLLEANASYAFERATGLDNQRLANSPQHIGKARLAYPLARNRVWISSALQYCSARRDRVGSAVRPVALGDVTLSTNRLHPNFDILCGIRNIANWRYWDPVAVALDRMPGDPRSFFLKLVWRTNE